MQRSRLTYLLVLSVLVNFGVLGAAAYQARDRAAASVDLASQLQLDAAQRQRWHEIEAPFLAELETGWREVARHREVLIRQIFSQQPDPRRIEEERARIAQLQAVQQRRVIAQLERERQLLDARQRQRLLELLLREPPPTSPERELHGS
ncbi:periplasmic heavy metal sensor [Ramlibacter sp. AN1133]|uniref:periplasmic heavy metal sensor n=1 Tax=Ramlibacter sp. AN1133 TaxID=3133429 RepID=UPI0030C10878